nr:hypothetical protein CTI12_AA557910 [Tanacetum cinerariifolium]
MFWHTARDDPMFTTIRVISKHQTPHIYGAILPKQLTNQAMIESEAYKTYYVYATGEKTPKPKYVQKKVYSEPSPKKKHVQAPKGKRYKATAKVPKSGKKKLTTQGLETLSEIALSEADQMKIATKRRKTQFYSSHASGSSAHEGTDDDDADNQGDDDQDDYNKQTESDNDDDIFVHPKLSTFNEEERYEEKQDEEEEGLDLRVQTPSHFESTNDEAYDKVTQGVNVEEENLDEEKTNEEKEVNECSVTTNVEMSPLSITKLPLPPIPLVQPQHQTPFLTPAIVLSTSVQNLPTFGSLMKFEDRVKSLEDNFSEFKQTNQFAEAISSIPSFVDKYLDNRMNKAVKVAVQLQSDRLREEAQAKNEDFINKLDENIKKVIKEQVKVHVKEQVSKILPRIKKLVNKQLEAEVLTCSSNEAMTSHVVAANLSELELKKILIDKMESNKLIHRLDQQKTLYKALIDAYNTAKVIIDTYGDTVRIKRRRDDEDEDEEPSAGSNRGQYPHDLHKPLPLMPNSQGRRVIPFDHYINNDLAYLRGGALSRTYATLVTKTKAADYRHIKWIKDLVPNTMWSLVSVMESAHDVYSRNIIITVTKLQIVKWHNYKQLDWITVHRNNDKLYTFKEGDYKRLRLQDIEDMLFLLVQGKLTNLTIKECLVLNVSLRMFTRSIVIQRLVEDLQLCVKSYKKKLNLTRPDTYRSDLKRLPTYSAYPNPRGFIYQNKHKTKKLMRIDELHKFSDDTLNDVRTALDDILKRIRINTKDQPFNYCIGVARWLSLGIHSHDPARTKGVVCKKEIDSAIMLIELIKHNEHPSDDELNVDDDVGEEKFKGNHFDKFPTCVYLMNDEDKKKGVEYVMSKILGFYKECLELEPEYKPAKRKVVVELVKTMEESRKE